MSQRKMLNSKYETRQSASLFIRKMLTKSRGVLAWAAHPKIRTCRDISMPHARVTRIHGAVFILQNAQGPLHPSQSSSKERTQVRAQHVVSNAEVVSVTRKVCTHSFVTLLVWGAVSAPRK